MALPVLTAEEQRVLGCLLEKQRTVPASYPLTLNSLRLACNQTSSRNPVVDYTDREIQDTARSLKDKGLLRLVWAGAGSRVVKYHQLIDEVLEPNDAQRALLTVLLLRGPQSAGELKTRTDRMFSFADKSAAEAELRRMAEAGWVLELPIQRGHQDRRWTHLLGPVPDTAPVESANAEAREAVLASGVAARDAKVIAAYAAAASAYAEATESALEAEPFDIWFLEQFAAQISGPIIDLGCGGGHIAAFLADTGAEVHGMDAAAEMVATAKANYPDLDFEVGRFHQLLRPKTASAWGGILIWDGFAHLAPSELGPTLAGIANTLDPGGTLGLLVTLGNGTAHQSELFGVPVDLDWVFHQRDQVLSAVAGAGLTVSQWYEKSAHPDELATSRLYVLAGRG